MTMPHFGGSVADVGDEAGGAVSAGAGGWVQPNSRPVSMTVTNPCSVRIIEAHDLSANTDCDRGATTLPVEESHEGRTFVTYFRSPAGGSFLSLPLVGTTGCAVRFGVASTLPTR